MAAKIVYVYKDGCPYCDEIQDSWYVLNIKHAVYIQSHTLNYSH